MEDILFHYRADPPNLITGIVVFVVLAAMAYKCSRPPKPAWVLSCICGVWCLFVVFLWTTFRLYPDEISITRQGMHGRCSLKHFQIDAAEIQSITSSRSSKGGVHVHVSLKNHDTAANIPTIWGEAKAAYQQALRSICPAGSTRFDW